MASAKYIHAIWTTEAFYGTLGLSSQLTSGKSSPIFFRLRTIQDPMEIYRTKS